MIRTGSIVDPPRPSSTPSWPAAALTAIVVLPFVALSQFIAQLDDAVLDDHLFGYFGWRLTQGARLYLDVWDHKPPGMFWINALGFRLSGGSYGGVIVLCILAQLTMIAMFFAAANRLFRRSTAMILTILAAVYLTHSRFFCGSNRSETYLAALEMALVLFYLSGWRKDRWWCWTAAGISGGVALLVKQSGFAAMTAALIHLAVLALTGRLGPREFRRRAGLIVIGASAFLLCGFGVLAVQGVLNDAWKAVVSANRVYLSIDHGGMGENRWWIRWQGFDPALLKLPIILALAALARAAAGNWMRRSSREGGQRRDIECPRPLTFLGTWLLISLSGPIVGPLASAHYVQPVLPPLLLLGGAFLDSLLLETGLLDTLRRRALTVLLLLIAAYFGGEALSEQCQKASMVYWSRRPSFEHGQLLIRPTAMEQIGREINQRMKPDDRIQCWDYLPEVYLEARRRSSSRFPDHLRAEWASLAGIGRPNEFAEAFQTAPPAAIVMPAPTFHALTETILHGATASSDAARWISDHYQIDPGLTRENLVVLRPRDGHSRD